MRERGLCEYGSPSPFFLRRVHDDLVVRHRADGFRVALAAETELGAVTELVTNEAASGALAFAAAHRQFLLDELPGSLTLEERLAIGIALEETGVFERV